MKKVKIFSINFDNCVIPLNYLNDQINTFLASQENGLSKELISLTQSHVNSGGIDGNQTLIITMVYDEK